MYEELYHHGIKGMKWGVRRWQNADGTYNAAGKKRYFDSVDEKKAVYKQAKKDYNKAYRDADVKSIQGLSPIKKHRQANEERWTRVKTAAEKVKTAEEEYKGEKLKVSADKYRKDMILKYSGKDSNKAAFYTNASDELIQKEFIRRENVKKAVIAGAAVVGVTAACYVAYKMSVNKQLNPLGPKVDKDAVKNALKNAQDDIDYVLPKGSRIHRMVGTAGFDVANQAGRRTYVTVNDSDRASYALFLKDWTGTGRRYDVTLEATRDIMAPSDAKAKAIFQEVWDNNPEYKQKLRDTLARTYAELTNLPPTHTSVRRLVDKDMRNPFKAGMYAFVKTGEDSSILQQAYVDRGYNAIVDYFDRGSLGKQPMIMFDAANDTVKIGEQFVDADLKKQLRKILKADLTHPMRKYV